VAALNEIIHQPARLRIMSALTTLDGGERMDFATLRDLLDLTDGNLGAHLAKLEEAGYLRLQKEFVERKPRTFLSVTAKGRAAFEEHVTALKSILEG
jgi:DNA-binding MarR family transcriptional regulator